MDSLQFKHAALQIFKYGESMVTAYTPAERAKRLKHLLDAFAKIRDGERGDKAVSH